MISCSIYIPRISSYWTKERIADIMLIHGVGTPVYVDFTCLYKKPGFTENYDSNVLSAYVHFESLPCLSDGTIFWVSEKKQKFWQTILDDKPYQINVNKNEYWICLKNKNPLKRTRMNIHQVVENGHYLETLIQAQVEKIKELETLMVSQSERIKKLEDDNNYNNMVWCWSDDEYKKQMDNEK
jgi:hypothetical protein